MFISFLYMFRATMCPSSGETTVFMRHLALVVPCGWLSGMRGGMNNKYQVSHKHCCFSWWWARSCPKHVENDKYTKNKLCTELALFTRLYSDTGSTKHEMFTYRILKRAGLAQCLVWLGHAFGRSGVQTPAEVAHLFFHNVHRSSGADQAP